MGTVLESNLDVEIFLRLVSGNGVRRLAYGVVSGSEGKSRLMNDFANTAKVRSMPRVNEVTLPTDNPYNARYFVDWLKNQDFDPEEIHIISNIEQYIESRWVQDSTGGIPSAINFWSSLDMQRECIHDHLPKSFGIIIEPETDCVIHNSFQHTMSWNLGYFDFREGGY